MSANKFIHEYIDPLCALLPYIKIEEFTVHARKIGNSFQHDTLFKTYDYLENQILTAAKERLDSYIKNRTASKLISAEAKKQLEIKAKNINAIVSLSDFIKAFQVLETSIGKLEPIKKKSVFDGIKNLFKS